MIFCSQVVSGAACGRYLEPLLGILSCLLWMILKKSACSLVIHVDGGMEPSNTLLAFSVSKFCLFRSVVCVSNCLRVHARVSARACVLGTLQA